MRTALVEAAPIHTPNLNMNIDVVGAASKDNILAGTEHGIMPIAGIDPNRSPKPHTDGAKDTWDVAYRAQVSALSEVRRGAGVNGEDLPALATAHLGGNGPNTGATLIAEGFDVAMVGVRGTDNDPVSRFVGERLKIMGFIDRMAIVEGYKPSVAAVTRSADDRHANGIKRDDMKPHLTAEMLTERISRSTGAVVLASLKEMELNNAVAKAKPTDAKLSVNFGSSEFNDHPDELVDFMDENNPFLLALNDEEALKLAPRLVEMGLIKADDPLHKVVEALSKFNQNVVCTLGKNGLYLANGGDSAAVHVPGVKAPIVRDTLGAGDNMHARILAGLLKGMDPAEAGAKAATQVAHDIAYEGAQGHLYSRVGL